MVGTSGKLICGNIKGKVLTQASLHECFMVQLLRVCLVIS
jgi:hypothetical protein